MRVDNGAPLGSPDRLAPPALALWLIGMDVDMIWNKPGCPQQNARVEKMQETTRRWAEISKAPDLSRLQQRLDKALVLQREQYPVSRLGNRSRLSVYPQLETSRRPYRASDFALTRVHQFLGSQLYVRKVSKTGQITHFGAVYSVGRSYRHQWVQVRLAGDGLSWEVLFNYAVVARLGAHTLSSASVQTLTVFQGVDTQLDGAS